MNDLPRNTILAGDVLDRLSELPDASIDCVITSPPYYQLRDYGVSGQLGLEATVEDWVTNLRAVCRELGRVLKPTGSLWLNLGDSFSRHARYGAPPKGLLLAPERLLVALAADGWIVRNKVIWAKTNPMPTSVGDRLTLTYELVFFLVRSRRYFFDLDAIREPFVGTRPRTSRVGRPETWRGPLAATRGGLAQPPSRAPGGQEPRRRLAHPDQGVRGRSLRDLPARPAAPPDSGELPGADLHCLRQAVAQAGEAAADRRDEADPEGAVYPQLSQSLAYRAADRRPHSLRLRRADDGWGGARSVLRQPGPSRWSPASTAGTGSASS